MATIAFIGADGAGKTTITRRVLTQFPQRTRYLYMGMSPSSNKYALPTSRLFQYVKFKAFQKRTLASPEPRQETLGKFLEANRNGDKRGKILATARLLNRVAEECFRQAISWYYQARGYTVIYDRHFLFDFAPRATNGERSPENRLTERLHRWFLNHVLPKPDLILFLDAPPEVLHARKGEATIEYLSRKREAYLRQGHSLPGFIRIDASRPLEQVYDEVQKILFAFFSGLPSAPERTPEQV